MKNSLKILALITVLLVNGCADTDKDIGTICVNELGSGIGLTSSGMTKFSIPYGEIDPQHHKTILRIDFSDKVSYNEWLISLGEAVEFKEENEDYIAYYESLCPDGSYQFRVDKK